MDEVAGIVTSTLRRRLLPHALRDNPGGGAEYADRVLGLAPADQPDRQFILIALAGFGGVWGTSGLRDLGRPR